MADLTFVDAAFPGGNYPPADGYAFYIGGDTPHVATTGEVAELKSRYRFLLPIYTRSNPPGPGAYADVSAARNRLQQIRAPRGCLVAWDMETAVDGPYIQQVYTSLRNDGYVLIVYGSLSTVFGERNPDGLYWGADWTGRAERRGGLAMDQWVSRNSYDESSAAATLPFWDTRSGPRPGPAPGPGPSGNWTEHLVNSLPVISQGASGQKVRNLQALLGAHGHRVTVDGSFGPATKNAAEAFQRAAGLGVDGVVGEHTWTALIQP